MQHLLVKHGQPFADDGKLRPVVEQHGSEREEEDLQPEALMKMQLRGTSIEEAGKLQHTLPLERHGHHA